MHKQKLRLRNINAIVNRHISVFVQHSNEKQRVIDMGRFPS